MSSIGFQGSNPNFPAGQSTRKFHQREAAVLDSSISVYSWWAIFVCSLIALIISSYLAWASFTSSPIAGCGGASIFNCDDVLHSRWSTVLSIPVSIPAIATHTLILTALIAKPISIQMKRVRCCIIGFASFVAGAAALWFSGLQIFLLQRLCQYCLVAHASGLLLAFIFIRSKLVETHYLKWIAGGALASLAGLVALQTISAAPQTFEVIDHTEKRGESGAAVIEEATLFEAPVSMVSPKASWMNSGLKHHFNSVFAVFSAIENPATLLYGAVAIEAEQRRSRLARVLNGVELDTAAWPLLGDTNAELVLVELFDYTCPHCKQTYSSIEGARQKYGNRLAVITLPVPLDRKCNPNVGSTHAIHLESCEIAKLAIAIWIVDRSKFETFHHYLFTTNSTYAQAMKKARTLVDETTLNKTLRGPAPNEYIAKHVTLYQKAGAGTIPKLMFPQATIVGAIGSTETMIHLLEKHLP